MKKRLVKIGSGRMLAAVLVAVVGVAAPSRGANQYYDVIPGTAAIDGGTANWSDLNWKASAGASSGGAWVSGNAAYFEAIVGSPSTTTITIAGTVTTGLNGVRFNGAGYTITGGTLDIGVDWFYMSQPATVNSSLKRLQVYNNAELSIGGGGTLTGRAIIGSSGAISQVRQTGGALSTGTEYMMIGGNGVANARGTYILDAGSLTVAQGIYFGWTQATSYGTLTQNGGTVETQTDTQGLQLGISGGHGTYNLNGGTLTSTFNTVSPGSADFNFGGGTFKARNTCSTWASMTTTIGAGTTAYIDTNGKTLTWSGPISGASAAGLTKSGAGTLAFNGANTYGGATTVSAGILKLGVSTALGGTTGVSVGSNATLDLFGQNISSSIPLAITASNYSPTGPDSLFNSSGTTATYAGPISLPVLTYIGGVGCGNMNLTGNISGAGYFAVIYGGATVKLSGVNTFGTSEKRTPIFGANTLQVSGGSAIPDDNRIQLVGTATFELLTSETVGNLDCAATTTVKLNDKTLTLGGDNGSYTFPATMTGTGGGIVKIGTGTLTISSANMTYTGGTTISGGTLKLGNASALGSSSSVTIDGGSLDLNGQIVASAIPVNMRTPSGSTPTIINSSGTAGSYNGNITLTGNTYTGGGSGTITLSGNITDNNNGYYVALYGTSITLALSGNNNFGRLAAWGGTAQLGSDTALASRTTVDLGYGGKLDVNGKTVTIARLSTSNANAGNEVKLGTGGVLTFGDASPVTYSEVISGGGSIVKQGSGTQIMSGINTYSGTTTISAGTLTFTAANACTGATTINGGTLLLSGTGSINSSSGVVLNGAGAKFLQASSTASTPPITLTQGTVDGVGTVGNITVGDLAGNTVAVGNGGSVLTTGNLTFNGSGTLSLPSGSTLAVNALAFASPTGDVTVNAGPAVVWSLGNNKLIGYASYDGLNLAALKVGAITGLGPRQAATGFFDDTTLKEIDLVVGGDSPVWTGLVSGDWTVTPVGGALNWKLLLGGTPTEYVAGDLVQFDDSVGGGITAINITDATVTPALVTFSNSGKDYTVGGNAIAGAGALVKSGTGTVTLSNANIFSGGTTVNGGTLSLSGGDNRLLSGGLLTLGGGTLALGANNQTVGGVTVNAGGGTVTGSGTFTNSGNPATAGNYVLNGNATLGAPLAGNLFVSGDGTSALTFSGGLATTANRIVAGSGGQIVQDGGTAATSNFMMLGYNNGTAGPSLSGTGAYTINSGTLTVGAGIYLGWNAPGNTGIMTQNGGTVETQLNNQGLQLGISGGHGTYNLNGGTLYSTFNIVSPGTQDFNFGGGTFKARANTATWASMTTTIGAGKTAYIDINGKNVTWAGPITGASAAGLTLSSSAAGGLLTLGGASTYAGVTTVNAGTLKLSGTAAINASGSLVVNGSGATFLQTSSTASTPPITLTQGTVDGVGTVGDLTVADLAGNVVAAGNGGTGVLTTGNLTFSGSGTLNLPGGSALAVNALAFSSPGGVVTVNAGPATAWVTGNNKLIGYASYDGANLANLKLGAITGLGTRQAATGFFNDTGLKEIALQVSDDTPVWTGLESGDWTVNAIGGAMNWKLASAGTPTDFLSGDSVLFDDSVGAGITALSITDATVTPSLLTFNNSGKDYTVGGNPIAGTTALVKSGTGTVTLGNANTFSGGTTVNGGTLGLSGGANRLLSGGLLTLGGGTLALGANNQTVGGVTVNVGGGAVTGAGTFTNSGNPATSGNYVLNGNATIGAPLAGNLYVSGNGTSALTFSGGLATTANRIVCSAGGNAIQDGGNVATSNYMMLGYNNGTAGPTLSGTGSYTINSGTLTIGGGIYLGWVPGCSGTFTQNGGTVETQSDSQGVQLGLGGGTGVYNLNGGTLTTTFGSGGAPYTYQTFNFGGGTFKARAATSTLSTLTTTIADTKTASIDANGKTVRWLGPITGAGAAGLTVSSSLASGVLTLEADSAFGGVTTINSGSLWLGNGTAAGSVAGDIVINNAAAYLRFQRTGTYTVANTISGPGYLIAGLGTLTLTGNNSYAGGTTVNSGTLKLGSDTALGTGTATVNGPSSNVAQLDLNGRTIANAVAVGNGACGGGSAPGCVVNSDVANPATIGGGLALGGANYLGGAGNVIVNGVVNGGVSDGSYAFLKQGAGTWTLANPASTFNGFVHIREGTLVVTKLANLNQDSSLGHPTTASANSLSFFSIGGTLKYVGADASTTDRTLALGANNAPGGTVEAAGTSAAATLTWTGAASSISAGARTLTLTGGNAGVNVFQGAITDGSGTVALTKSGATTWALAGANAYTGATLVNGGTLQLRNGALTSQRTALTLSDATLENAAGAVNDLGTLTSTGASTLIVRSGSSLRFADSNALRGSWTGTLNIVGRLDDNVTLRVGTSASGLDPTQLARITNGGSPVEITADGYLIKATSGTQFILK